MLHPEKSFVAPVLNVSINSCTPYCILINIALSIIESPLTLIR